MCRFLSLFSGTTMKLMFIRRCMSSSSSLSNIQRRLVTAFINNTLNSPLSAHKIVSQASSSSAGSMGNNEEVSKTSEHVTRVLFCGPDFPASHIYTREYLSEHRHIQVDVIPFADVPGVIGNYHLCVSKNLRVDSTLLSNANKMKLVMQFGVGIEGIDVNAATKYGIKVARIPGDVTGNAASCAEMAIYLMLGLLRKQIHMRNSIKQKKLGEPVGDNLIGKTVFIMGFGNIGLELAKRLKPFGVKIIATKRIWVSYLDTFSILDGQNHGIDDLVDKKGSHNDIYKFASIADIVVCCLSLSRETAAIVNHSFFTSMKKGAYLVNVARGGLLDYDAVASNLKSGHLGGLGIDVAWSEPFDPDDPILKFPNVLITPHVAGITEHSYRSMAKVVGDVAIQLHEGTPLTGIEIVN
ncbi:hypothetical protein Droror1_Dr00027454 [Drosera rotundifolia]